MNELLYYSDATETDWIGIRYRHNTRLIGSYRQNADGTYTAMRMSLRQGQSEAWAFNLADSSEAQAFITL